MPRWQATAKGLTAFVLCPVVWTLESVLVLRRFGRRAALAAATAGPIGGLAWIAWRARWLKWRRMLRVDELQGGRGTALAAARDSREVVLLRVAGLVGESARVGTG